MEEEYFWRTVKIWSTKPHVVNKRLSGVAVSSSWKLPSSSWSSWVELVKANAKMKDLSHEEALETIDWEKASVWTAEDEISSLHDDSSICRVSLRKCLPKQPHRHQPVFELEFLDFKLNCAVYIPLRRTVVADDALCPPCTYAITFDGSVIDLHVYEDESNSSWLVDVVLPKLRKWYSEMDKSSPGIGTESLRLISFQDYDQLYRELKEKYVPSIAKIWPECTDPQKFIHEDVAIAAYLLLIWRKEREDLGLPPDYRQSFLDIGCGNGLLVFLLASEGHPGKGLDIRSRKIWSLYPPEIRLEASTVIPTEETVFTDFDWLLGNHSDELTPWIPVMALQSTVQRLKQAASSLLVPAVRFWVLPCCPFSFFGKFQRPAGGSSGSRYLEYLRYVCKVGETCGYKVEEDRMRIPSTRRTCFVGTSPKEPRDWTSLLTAKAEIIASESSGSTSFQPRPAVEPVRNCTRIDRAIQDELVNLTAKCLLAAGSRQSGTTWNAGGTVEFPALVEALVKDFKDFDRLKKECGGLQTLLRNHSHIFVVQGKAVRFRSPDELSSAQWRAQKKKVKMSSEGSLAQPVKRKPCWFYSFHPDGCPLDNDGCRYLHLPVADKEADVTEQC